MNVQLPAKWASKHYKGHNEHIPGTTAYLRSRTFQSYFNMIVRCMYSSCRDFHCYGGRGITVHPEWVLSFDAFIRDVGHRPRGMTLDRIDPEGNYEPGNIQWATPKEQTANRRINRRKTR